MIKADFHIHVQGDPKDDFIKYSLFDLIDQAVFENFSVIAVTNHRQIFDTAKAKQYAADNNILLISGIEHEVKGVHVIVLWPHEDILKVNSFAQLLKYRKQHPESFIIAPHPYYPWFSCLNWRLKKHYKCFDAVEYSHMYLSFFNLPNKLAISTAKKLNIPVLGSSDLHYLKYFGTTYTVLNIDCTDEQQVRAALKDGNFSFSSSPVSIKRCCFFILEVVKSLTYRIPTRFIKQAFKQAAR